jgi:oxygen-independent coproporphyrinogen-3 oxidase
MRAYRELTGRAFLRDHKRLVQALHQRGLVRIRDGYLRFTRSGMLVSDSILARLFADVRALLAENGQEARLDSMRVSGETNPRTVSR